MGAGPQDRHIWRFLEQAYKGYIRANCLMMAAAISFYVLLSLIPLSLVALSAFGYVLGHESASQAVFGFLERFVPTDFGGTALRAYLKHNVQHPRGLNGAVGLAGLVWVGSVSIGTITQALNIVYGVERRRGWVGGRLRSVGMTLVGGLLVLASFSLTQAIHLVRDYRVPGLDWQPGQIPFIWSLVGWVVPPALSVLVFVLCYAVLPDARIGWRPALTGGMVGGLLWEAAKQGFAIYIANFAHYNKIYGSLGGMAILITWVYYSAAILLAGGEVACVSAEWLGKPRTLPRRRTKK